MFNVADYLKKFSKIAEDSAAVKEAVTKAFFEVCGTAGVSFEVKKGIVYVQGTSTLKALMFMNKAQVLARLRAELPKTKIFDIR
jgi:hypothetical protein